MKYNKLVRDKIPEIIKQNEGKVSKTRILSDEEYLKQLNLKIKEEVNEYLESGEIEELADIEEVLRAILKYKNVSYKEFEDIRKSKVKKRGAFEKRIYLMGIEEKE